MAMIDMIAKAEEELDDLKRRRDYADKNGTAKAYLDLCRAVRRKEREIREAKKHLKEAQRKKEEDPEDLEETIQWALQEVRKS